MEKKVKKNNSSNLKKTLIWAVSLSLITIIVAVIVQLNAESKLKLIVNCSYFDPWIVDLLSFFAAFFLIIEGFARILENPKASVQRQLTRIIRIAFGFSILTFHIIQLWHK